MAIDNETTNIVQVNYTVRSSLQVTNGASSVWVIVLVQPLLIMCMHIRSCEDVHF